MPQEPRDAAKEASQHIARQSQDVAETAKDVKASASTIEDSAARTTRLAADRTVMAAERTYASWVRTGLFALTSGVGARALLTGILPEWLILADSSLLILFSVFCFGAAIWRYIHPGPPPPRPDVRSIPREILFLISAFLGAVSLAALFGVWISPPR